MNAVVCSSGLFPRTLSSDDPPQRVKMDDGDYSEIGDANGKTLQHYYLSLIRCFLFLRTVVAESVKA